MKRRGCGCRIGCGCGCLGFFVVAVILLGGFGVLVGNWAGIAHPKIPQSTEVANIPPEYLVLYEQAATRFGLDWSVLAAIGEVETNHGRNANGCAPNAAGAEGPMQFLPATFAHAAKLAGLTKPDICDPADAIPAAAAYLVSNGAPADWTRALYRYNPADWYPPLVMGWAQRYGYGALIVWPVTGTISQGFGPTTFTRRAGPLLSGPLLPPLPRWDRHRGTARDAGPGDRDRAGGPRRAAVGRRGRRRDRAQPGRDLAVRAPAADPRRPRGRLGRRRRGPGLGRPDRQHDRAAPPFQHLRRRRADRSDADPAGAAVNSGRARR